MTNTLTPSTQDYLEVILKLSAEEKQVRITDIANSLNITKASVTEAINMLSEQNLVTKEKYGPVSLTEKGRQEAQIVKKLHKVIYEFLVKILQVPPEIADKDACLMEHVISHETICGMLNFLEKAKQTSKLNNNPDDTLDLEKAKQILDLRSEYKHEGK